MQNKRSETCNKYNKQTKQLTRWIINKQNQKPKQQINQIGWETWIRSLWIWAR
jgi:hypothetical protein